MNLYKINDVVGSEFIRFPLDLLANPKYKAMSIESKVVYSLLLNRLTLSQRNGWLNEQNEVYLIYTREETANTLGITYKKAIAAFKELLEFKLILEKRRGRGYPNIIYIVKTELSEDDAKNFKESFDESAAEGAGQSTEPLENTGFFKNRQNIISRTPESAHQDMPKQHIKTFQNSTSRTADMEYPELPKQHTSKIENKNIDFSEIYISQSIGPAETEGNKTRGYFSPDDGLTDDNDAEIIDAIFENCEPEIFNEKTQIMFRTAIERLYYSDKLKICNAVLPQEKVRSYLHLLDADVLVSTYEKLKSNDGRVRNPMAYTMSVLFNCICERESDLLANLPPEYVNGGDYFASD